MPPDRTDTPDAKAGRVDSSHHLSEAITAAARVIRLIEVGAPIDRVTLIPLARLLGSRLVGQTSAFLAPTADQAEDAIDLLREWIDDWELELAL